MLVHIQLDSREREIIHILTLSLVPGISDYAGTNPNLMEGMCKGSRHIAEGKQQVLKLKQNLTHQLNCLDTVPIQHDQWGICTLHTFPGEGPSRVFLGPSRKAFTSWCNVVLPSKMNQPKNASLILSLSPVY